VTAAKLAVLLVAFGTSAYSESSQRRAAPAYSADSIVHSATNRPGPFAPNTIATIYGTDLAYSTLAPAPKDNVVPNRAAGVQVLANGSPVPLLYVSPGQINLLIPASLVEGSLELRVVREGTAGAAVKLRLDALAPGLYQRDANTVLASHADDSAVTAEQPARPGETVTLYATGLGYTVMRLADDQVPVLSDVPASGMAIQRAADLRVLLNGQPLDASAVLYAGLCPGYAGLYQVKVALPAEAPVHPELRIAFGDLASPEGVKLPLAPQPSSPAARLSQ